MNPAQASTDRDAPQRVILFDGVCNLCNGFVQFVIRRDPMARFRFAALQTAAAQRMLQGRIPEEGNMDTVIYLRKGRVLVRSSAALFILRDLGGGWALFSILLMVPRPLRDAPYRWIARHRYGWFGRREQCMVPTPALRERFLGP